MPIPVRTYSRGRRSSFRDLFDTLFDDGIHPARVTRGMLILDGVEIPRFTSEFWTSKQRQASSLHEVSYRACFKPQLPRYFIDRLTQPDDIVYDPFMGRGTTLIEAALLGRRVIGNDANPLSRILTRPRLHPPLLQEVARRIDAINTDRRLSASLDLSMFYHPRTEKEILALRHYLMARVASGKEDDIDRWIRMVATNRLTGHSRGFFSVYTLPPNQAMSQENQRNVNRKRGQRPEYRNVKELILRKTRFLLRNLTEEQRRNLATVGRKARFITTGAWQTRSVADNSVRLTITSPPFLDTVDYAQDNWLRCWFNDIDREDVRNRLTVVRSVEAWTQTMARVFKELYRITCSEGVLAFEVGEIRKRNLRLDEVVVPIGLQAGFCCGGILINQQRFTKTSNIWGIHNNQAGTNTNRIVLFQKSHQSTR